MQSDRARPEPLTDPRRTWRITDDRRLPVLEPFADEVRRSAPVVLRETVWDTDDRVLAAEGVELLRSADGWAVDRGDGPETVPAAAAADGVPRDAVEVFLRGREVRAVRVRDTVTTLVLLVGRDGRVRAEVADVRVDEGDPDTALLRSARWWALTDDGHGSATARATERALDDAAPEALERGGERAARSAPIRREAASKPPRRGSAAAVVQRALRLLRADLVAVDPRVRRDEHESVHDLRKVLRRIRSVLAAFRGALDRDATESLRAELASIGRVAGVVRDAEVLRDRLLRTAARAPEGYVDAATLDRIGAHVDALRESAAAELRQGMGSEGWFGALDALDDLVARAPRGPHGDDDTAGFVARRIAHERARVVAAVGHGTDRPEDLHEVRKAARRLRYALQAVGDRPELGKRRLGRLRRVQETLGEVLDAGHAAAAHREVAALAARDGADTFGYGVLATTERAVVEREQARAERMVAKLVARL